MASGHLDDVPDERLGRRHAGGAPNFLALQRPPGADHPQPDRPGVQLGVIQHPEVNAVLEPGGEVQERLIDDGHEELVHLVIDADPVPDDPHVVSLLGDQRVAVLDRS